METKYIWDITVEKKFSKKQMDLASEVANTISHGGDVRELQKTLKQINFL